MGVGLGVGLFSAVGVGVKEGVDVGLFVIVAVGVTLGAVVGLEVPVGVGVRVIVGLFVGETVSEIAMGGKVDVLEKISSLCGFS